MFYVLSSLLLQREHERKPSILFLGCLCFLCVGLQGGQANTASGQYASVVVRTPANCIMVLGLCVGSPHFVPLFFFLVFFLVKATCASSMWWLRGEKQEIMFSCWCWFVAVWFAGWFWEHCQWQIFFSVGPKLSLLRQPRYICVCLWEQLRDLVFHTLIFSPHVHKERKSETEPLRWSWLLLSCGLIGR